MVAHQHERPGCVARFEPVQRFVGDDVGDIARVADRPAGFMEHRVVVVTLAGDHGPVVKAGGLVRRTFAQMPFTKNGGLVAATAQVLGHVGQAVVDAVGQRHDAVHMVVGAGQNRRAAGGANGVADIAVVHPHALLGQTVDVGGLVDAMPVTADGLGRMVVGHDENNIRSCHVQLVSVRVIQARGRSSRRRPRGSMPVWLRQIPGPTGRRALLATRRAAGRQPAR